MPWSNLTPFIPLSFKGEGEENKKEGLTPLLDAPVKTGEGNTQPLSTEAGG